MYALTALFWYRAVFMLELVIAESLAVFRLKRRRKFFLRLAGALFLCFGFAFAVPIVAYNAVWCSVMFLSMFLVSTLAVKLCFDENWRTVFFCAVVAYTLQHIAYTIFDFYTLILGSPAGNLIYGDTVPEIPADGNILSAFFGGGALLAFSYLYIYGLVYFFGFLFAAPRLRSIKETGLTNMKSFITAAIILFFDIVLSAIITYFCRNDVKDMPMLSKYIILLDLYNIFCCVFALYLQHAMDKRGKLKNDLDTVTKLWDEKRRQYAVSKENIDLVNQKCHDLKHQIRKMGGKNSLSGDVIRELEDVISVYDCDVKTGNEALDVIISEKSLQCNGSGVKILCIADGKQLDFISPSDLYALFGNILDNAVETVSKLDGDRRTVNLNIKAVGSFVIVNTYNYYEGALEFEENLPKTTKENKTEHGYGMKSISMLCKKYGGEMSLTAENNIFNLNLVFPVPSA